MEKMSDNKLQLSVFLQDMWNILELIINNIEWLAPDRKDIHKLMKETWEELRDRLDTSVKMLAEISDKDLDKEGLSGIQLQLKLREYTWKKDKLSNTWEEFSSLVNTKPKLGIIRKAISKVIKAIDNILDSLSNVIAPIHAIKEIKDTIDSIIS